jgi:F-type H+-transporting ATPase subunit a
MDVEKSELPNFLTFISEGIPNEKIGALLVDWQDPIFSVIIAVTISIVFYLGSRHRELMPRSFQNFLEYFAEVIESVANEIIGPQGRKFAPFIGRIFIYVLSMNWAGLVPLMKSPTSNISITVGLAICVFALVQYLNIKNMGFFGFIYHLAGSPKGALGWSLVPLMLPIEVITQFARPLTLSLRLCGNVLGEDIFIALTTIFGVYLLSHLMIPVGIPLELPFLLLGFFTGFLQALVFTLLTTIYILLSIPGADEEHPS